MKKLLTLTLAFAVMATLSGFATAETTIRSTKSNGSERVTADQPPSPRDVTTGQSSGRVKGVETEVLTMTGKVTEVNNQANTFTVMAKGKAVVFSAPTLSKLPTVGEIIDITYTQTPGGPMEFINLNSSRSNVY